MDKPLHWVPGIARRGEQLRRIGVRNELDLYADVPPVLLLREPPRVGFNRILSEEELRRLALRLASRIRIFREPPPFTGGGWCPHIVPSIIDYIVSRGEFLTAYTPYQPEINQGLLQALFEYQSLIADLVELEVVNASLYDGSTAVAEAALMAMRVTRRKKVVVADTLHPEYISVLRTWLYGKDAELVLLPHNEETYSVDIDAAEKLIDEDTSTVIVASPNFYGAIDPGIEALSDIAHKHGALLVQVFEPLSLGIIKPPGQLGVDIAVAEGQPLGLGLNYGGPGLGIFAIRWDRKLIRQLPGRLIGMTRDAEGNRAFTMILQTREQHIRREKATSNITTNEALMAIRAAIFLTLLGGDGLRRLARSIWLRSHYLAKKLEEIGLESHIFTSEFFKEFTVRFPKAYRPIYTRLAGDGILAGLDLGRYGLGSGKEALFCATELHSKKDIDLLVEKIATHLER
jgi:glycine dehydrogenase subunit 1